MVKGFKLGQMEIHFQDILFKVKRMELVNLLKEVVMFIEEILKIIK